MIFYYQEASEVVGKKETVALITSAVLAEMTQLSVTPKTIIAKRAVGATHQNCDN